MKTRTATSSGSPAARRRRPAPALVAALFLSSFAAGCPRPAGLGLNALEEAARRVEEGEKSPRNLALAGFSAYLLESKADKAAPLFEAAAKAHDVWGLWGKAELARRRLDTRERVLTGLRICAQAPLHPLCAVAARAAVSSTGVSPGLDRAIEAAAVQILSAGGAGGEAAYRLRLAAAAARRNRGDDAGARALWAEAGQMTAATLLGPYSPYHSLDWDTAYPPESGDARGGTAGPHGPIAPRPFQTPDGRLTLAAEPTTADISYWAADLSVPEPGRYHLRAVGRGTFRLLLDNAVALDQRELEAWLPQERVVEVLLPAGPHRLVAKVSRGTDRADSLWVALSRADGKPAALRFSPARGTFTPAAGGGDGPLRFDKPAGAWPDAAALAVALEEEAGSALAAYVSSRAVQDRDPEGALALADALVQKAAGAPFLVLRAEALLASRSLPARIGTGRARRDLEDAVKADPGEASAWQRLSIHARGESRFEEAAELLEKARAAAAPGSWRVLLSEMKLAQARGADAVADEAAQRALAAEPGLCDAVGLRYDLARRLDAVALADALVKELGACPGRHARLAEHARLRGDLAAARARFTAAADAAPLETGARLNAAQLALAQDQPLEAAAMLLELQRAWPLQAHFHKKRAEALEKAGDRAGARAEREAALALDGSDLKLRRALAVEDGREILDELKSDPKPLLARWEAAHGGKPPTSAGVYILDASAVEAHPDGAFTERTHVLAKVLSQAGVGKLAEVHLPSGAEILALRTLKADGRVLEPEAIGGKEGISLPGVEVGDCVEYDYLRSTPSRGPAMPGFAAPKFYFRIADGQLFHSSYRVRAPAGGGLTVDAHNMEAPPVRREGAWDVVSVEREEMPTFVREPGMGSMEEVIPFVQVGQGAGLVETFTGLADFLHDRAKPNAEVTRFAQLAAAGKPGMEAVRAVYARVMQEVKGPEAPASTRATWTLAQGRGSRLMLLKGALSALGIRSRLVLVKPFGSDPADYRFPSAEQYAYLALSVRVAGGSGREEEVLLTPGIRFAPFGRLAAQAEGQPAVVLPEVGEKLRTFTTPGAREADGKKVRLSLALDAEGTLTGTGEEVYEGMEAAFLKTTLEKLNQDQRKQAIEASIARTFDNGTLQSFSVEETEEPGAPVTLRYALRAPGFARAEPGRLTVPRGIYPTNLSRRFLHQFERKTPLVVGSPEKTTLSVTLTLPAGYSLAGAPQSATRSSPFGRFERVEEASPGLFAFRESVSLNMARVPPEQYRAFGELLAAADRAEQREVVFTASGPAVPPAK